MVIPLKYNMDRQIEPGVIVFAVIFWILNLMRVIDLHFGIFPRKYFKDVYFIFGWLIAFSLIFWSLFINKYWGIFIFVFLLTLFIIEKYEPKPYPCVFICFKKSQIALLFGTMGVTGINTLVTLYILTKYFMSS